jgi:hypothetical protein
MGKNDLWHTEVKLENGGEFHCDNPCIQVGEVLEFEPNGSYQTLASDGTAFVWNPKWIRLPNL